MYKVYSVIVKVHHVTRFVSNALIEGVLLFIFFHLSLAFWSTVL